MQQQQQPGGGFASFFLGLGGILGGGKQQPGSAELAAQSKGGPPSCSPEFRQVWGGFVDAFVDTLAANGPAANPMPEDGHVPTVLPAVPRIIAIGDLHGDISKMRAAFRLGGLIDEKDHWVGGKTVCVQVGDQLDRGNQEIAILYHLERLKREAERAGGKLYTMSGNHESMNVMGRFRYATSGGMLEFIRWRALHQIGNALKIKCGVQGTAGLDAAPPSHVAPGGQARWAALAPGGEITRRFLAHQPTVLQIGQNLFVHGGVLPQHVQYGLQRINDESRDWMLGRGPRQPPDFLLGRNAIVWTRQFSEVKRGECNCDLLKESLSKMPGATRMVVGHTIQQPGGISAACDNMVFRIDVGMSEGCGNWTPEVLEIMESGEVRRYQMDGTKSVVQTAADADDKMHALHPSHAQKKGGWASLWRSGG